MIEKYIGSSLDYLLGNTDSAGRSRESELVDGDLPSLRMSLQKAQSKYKHPHSTFSYRDPQSFEELGGQAFEDELKERITEKFLPGLNRRKFDFAFIRHHNADGSYELNFFMVQMDEEEKFFPANVDKMDRKVNELFSRKLHQDFPNLSNPFDRPQLLAPNTKRPNMDNELVDELNELLDSALKKKHIKNREDFLKLIEERGYGIARKGKDYITIVKGNTKMRFKGEACKRDFDPETLGRSKPPKDPTDYTKAYKDALEKKRQRLLKRYKRLAKEPDPVTQKNAIEQNFKGNEHEQEKYAQPEEHPHHYNEREALDEEGEREIKDTPSIDESYEAGSDMYLIISMAILEAQESLSEKQYAIIPISAFNLSGDLSK